jgi:transmembrane sensor
MNMSIGDAGSSNISSDDWERIARYITGEATPAEAQATRQWIDADPHRVGVVQLLESVVANVFQEQSPAIDVERALGSVKARFDDPKVIPFAPRPPKASDSRGLSALLRIAAAAVIIAGATMIWQNTRRSRVDGSVQTYATSVGERREVTLRDGTKVLLGPTSRLIVPITGDDGRTATLDGIGYFNVVHDSAHPFTVKAGAITVQDVGTAFSIESDDSAGARVAVDSGSVAIGAAGGAAIRGAVLNARDRAVVDINGVVAIERSAVSADDLAWVQGRLVFRDAPLVLVGAELYRWYGVRLRVADSSLANLHLTASFSGEPVDRVLNVIALSLGASIERQGNVAILHRASASGARQ